MAQVENERAVFQQSHDPVDLGIQRRPADHQRHRIQIALHRQMLLQLLHHRDRGRAVGGDRIDLGGLGVFQIAGAGTARKPDDRGIGMQGLHTGDDPDGRRDHQAIEQGLWCGAGQAVEQFDDLRTGLDLPVEIGHRGVHDPVDQRLDQRRVPKRHFLQGGEVAAGAAFDNVGGHRPGAAGEPDHGHPLRQHRAGPGHGLVDRADPFVERIGVEHRDLIHGADRRQLRAFPFGEPEILAQTVGHHQNIGEQDRPIHAVAADRLNRDLGSQFGIETQIDEGSGSCAHLAIFGQIPAGLAHQPERGSVTGFARERIEKRESCHVLSSIYPTITNLFKY